MHILPFLRHRTLRIPDASHARRRSQGLRLHPGETDYSTAVLWRAFTQRSDYQEDAVEGGCSVLILVSADVDGIAGLRLLTYLLRIENIQYTVKTVR